MHSEADIRRQVETRLKRRGLVVLDGGLWGLAVFFLWQFSSYSSFGSLAGLVILFMLAWTAILGLHFLRTVYVELREWLVRRAIEHERRYYVQDNAYEKPKHDEAVPRLSDDGELTDYADIAARSGKQD